MFTVFLILSFVVWRLSSLLVHEDGPFQIFKKFREKFDEESFMGELLACIHCTSIWVAAFVWALYLIFPGVVNVLGFLAVATSASLIDGVVE